MSKEALQVLVYDKDRKVTIEYEFKDIGNNLVKGIMTINDPNLSLMTKRDIRGIIGIPVKKAIKMEALIVTTKDNVEELTPKYIYKHFLGYMKPTVIKVEGKDRDV